MRRILALLLAALLLAGCAPQSKSALEQNLESIHQLGSSPDDNYRTWYEIFVYSFCDSNGDGIGDIKGVTSKLDYLQELGINGIWLMPVHPSQSYHKYDVADYYAIDPAYGTLEDFREFLAECEKRDIHVIMDLVLNHTGNDHTWFLTAVDYLKSLPAGAEPDSKECPYIDYYSFSRELASGYHAIEGSEWYYEGVFSPHMPDLRLENGLVRQEIDAIMAYWLGMGVSGFRLDAAKEFYTGAVAKNVEVLSFLQETATAYKENAYLVAEVWDSFAAVSEYYTSGITSLFNFPFATSGGVIVKTLRSAGKASTVEAYARNLQTANESYSASNPNYIDAPFLSNHDVGRIASFCQRDEAKVKLAGAMNLFMSGSAFIYYGEEIGMVAGGTDDPSKRAPMYWNAARDNGTTDLPPDCTLPDEYPFGSLEEQQENETSVYNYYRQAVAIRQAVPAISHGITTVEEGLNRGCVSAQRKTWGEEECILLMNIDEDAADVDLSGYDGWTLAAALSVDSDPITMEGTTLHMDGFGIAVLVKE